MKAHRDALEGTTELAMAAAYHNAALSLADPKKFPRSFSDWFGKPVRERAAKQQSAEEIGAAFLHWALSTAPPKEDAN